MEKVDGSITTYGAESVTEDQLFTYCEEERQRHSINAAHAKLVFSPEFIPFYFDVKKKYNLTYTATILYGFIRFYRINQKTGRRFYFTNEQLSEIMDCSVESIKRAVKQLKDTGLIVTKRKMRSGGGTIRFIEGVKTS